MTKITFVFSLKLLNRVTYDSVKSAFLTIFDRSYTLKSRVFIEIERNSTILHKTCPNRSYSYSHWVYKNIVFMVVMAVLKASLGWKFTGFFKNTRFYTIHSNWSVCSSVYQCNRTFIETTKLHYYIYKFTLCFWTFVTFWQVNGGFRLV